MTQYISNIDWPALHAAFTALDKARRMTAKTIGHDGISDAFGGSYYGPSYEAAGLQGAVRMLNALAKITDAAWHIVHSGMKCATSNPIEHTDQLIRSAVAVMLAARPAYDLLADAGLCRRDAQSITRGNDGRYLHVTGLHWVAGVATDRRVTVAQAEAIVAGAKFADVLSDRDEHHDTSWIVG